jgi:hypothetical protein
LHAPLTVIWLLLLRGAGWDWELRSGAVHSQPSTVTALRSAARASLCTLTLVAVCLLGFAYWRLLPPPLPPPQSLPVPNGYDELARAADAVNWDALPGLEFDPSNLAACQQFLENNAHTFASVGRALSIPAERPVELADFRLDEIQAFRSLCRALQVRVKTAEAAGRFSDAMQSNLDIVRLGHSISHGGLIIDDLVAAAIECEGVEGIVDEIAHLDAADLMILRQSLEELVDAREPWHTVAERDRIWSALSFGWSGRLYAWLNEVSGAGVGQAALEAPRLREVARLRLIIAESAVRQHALVEGSPPESLESLVPKYLAKVPQDPYGQRPLVYRRTSDGYLLYSVGKNKTDDGGRRATLSEATTDGVGDLFFDAPHAP